MQVVARALIAQGDEAGATAASLSAADEAARVGLRFMHAQALGEESVREQYAARRAEVVAGLQSDEREVTELLGP